MSFNPIPASPTFGTIQPKLQASDYITAKKNAVLKKNKCKPNHCIIPIPFNKANLSIGLYAKENLENVKVIQKSNTSFVPCAPFYQNFIIDPEGLLFGKSQCGVNNYIHYMDIPLTMTCKTNII